MLVVPIVAAHGMLIPKTSSRAITSPAGTADTMEVLATSIWRWPTWNSLCVTSRLSGLGRNGAFVTGGRHPDFVERPLGIDSNGQMVASILSKKMAAGSSHLLIDIPVGPSAKVRHMHWAQQLRRLLNTLAIISASISK